MLARLDVEAVVTGVILSQYQKKHVDAICQELGLKHISPLWHEDPLKLLREMVRLGMETIIVGVYAYGFDETWLRRKIDGDTIKDLLELYRKLQVSLVGEGGEYETLILDAPFFKRKIKFMEKRDVWEGQSGRLIIKKAVFREIKIIEHA